MPLLPAVPVDTHHSQGTPRPHTQPQRPLKATHFLRELHLQPPFPFSCPKTPPAAASAAPHISSCCSSHLPLPRRSKGLLELGILEFLVIQELLCLQNSLSQGPALPVRPNTVRLPVTAPPRTAGTARPGPCCRTHSSGTSCPEGGTAPWSGHCSRCKGSAHTQGRQGGRERLQHRRCVCINRNDEHPEPTRDCSSAFPAPWSGSRSSTRP